MANRKVVITFCSVCLHVRYWKIQFDGAYVVLRLLKLMREDNILNTFLEIKNVGEKGRFTK